MKRIRIPFTVSEFHERLHIPCNKPFSLEFLTFKNPVHRVLEWVFDRVSNHLNKRLEGFLIRFILINP